MTFTALFMLALTMLYLAKNANGITELCLWLALFLASYIVSMIALLTDDNWKWEIDI